MDETIMLTIHNHSTPLELLPRLPSCAVSSFRPSLNNVVALPELAEIIAFYLSRSDYVSLVRCSRAWRAIWTPYLYNCLDYPQFQNDDPNNAYYRALVIYGHLVRTLEITRSNYTLPLIQLLPNLTTLALNCARLDEHQLKAILGLVPRLRILRCRIMTHSHLSIALATSLKYLEKLEWHYYTATDAGEKGEVDLDDLLLVFQSCPRLGWLSLAHGLLMATPESFEDSARILDHDQDDNGANLKLWRMDWTSVYVSMPSDRGPHPLIQRLFKQMQSLKTFRVQGRSNLTPLDWSYIFRNKNDMEHLCLISSVVDTFVREALEGVAPSQTRLRSLKLGGGASGTNAPLKEILHKNQKLEWLSAHGCDLGDQALQGLLRHQSIGNSTLRHLDLQNCIDVTSRGAAIVLETCQALFSLDLRGTLAGKWDLFQGDRPWVCSKSLRELYMDIQPRTCMLPMGHEWDMNQGSVDPEPYSPEEEDHIKKRIHGFGSLKVLFLRGHAMSFTLVDRIATMTSLQSVDLRIPEQHATRHWFVDGYQRTRLQAVSGVAQTLFPQWKHEATWRCLSSHRYYYSIHAKRNPHSI